MVRCLGSLRGRWATWRGHFVDVGVSDWLAEIAEHRQPSDRSPGRAVRADAFGLAESHGVGEFGEPHVATGLGGSVACVRSCSNRNQ